MDEIFSLTLSEGAISNMLAARVNRCWGGGNDPRDGARHSGGVFR
jgi:hypothetical protein